MADIDAIRVDNFNESLRLANRYLTLGLFSSVFLLALSLDPAAFASEGKVSVGGGVPPLPVRYALIALALVYWVSPFLAYFSLARAERIGLELGETSGELLKAALSFPCIATTKVHGPRWVAGLFPPFAATIAGWRTGLVSPDGEGIMALGLVVLPYVTLFVLKLRRAIGGLEPDAHGD